MAPRRTPKVFEATSFLVVFFFLVSMPNLPLVFIYFFLGFSFYCLVQVGLRRIDAAFDALRPMGFTDDVVRKTIRKLLKVTQP